MINWTKNQQEAIDSRDQNLLLSAAAGSGKTAVLVERILNLMIKDRISIDEMLIITFTRAAAGEMRERILQRLSKALTETTANQKFIKNQMRLLNSAHISTIHSFCMEVIKKNFHQLELDSSFKMIDSSEKELLFLEVIDEVLEKEYQLGNSTFKKIVEFFTSDRDDQALKNIIMRVYSFIMSKPDPFEWLDKNVDLFQMSSKTFKESIWSKTFQELMAYELRVAKQIIKEAIDVANAPEGPTKYLEAFQSDLDLIIELEGVLEKDLEVFFEALNTIQYKSLSRKKEEGVSPELKELSKAIRKEFKKHLGKIASKFEAKPLEAQLEDINKIYPLLKYISEIIKKVHENYQKEKFEKNVVDFNDLEHLCLELLQHEEIRLQYKKQFKAIFIDEYQDTNILQETIINSIKRENNLFLVGDVKQSIYKFRLAEPSLFLNKYTHFSYEKTAMNRVVELAKNFRSRGDVLHGINFIFEHLMSEEFGEINYNKKTYLNPGLDFEVFDDHRIEINLINADKKTRDEDIEDQRIRDLKTSEIEATAIAMKIKNLMKEKTFDKKSGEIRPVRYQDIAILMRATNNWGQIFEQVLIDHGIPLYYEGGSGFLNSLEIEIFLNLLKVIDNKRRDIELLSVMRSPIGKFSIDEIITIKINSTKDSYFEALVEYGTLNNPLSKKVLQFINQIQRWFEISKRMEVDEFILYLLRETNYMNYVSAMPGGNLRKGNLKLLINRAKKFSQSSLTGVFNFVHFIERMHQTNIDLDAANVISENEDVVRLMSIHKSKGLEFPIVFIARGNHQMRNLSSRNKVVLHKELGIGCQYIDLQKRVKYNTLNRVLINQKKHYENLAEEMRILYVGMTRAIDQLFIYGTYTRGLSKALDQWTRKNSKNILSNAKSYVDWIMRIISDTPGAQSIYDKIDRIFSASDKDLFKVNIIELEAIAKAITSSEHQSLDLKTLLKTPKAYNTKKIDAYFDYEYSLELSDQLTKVSATELKSMEDTSLEEFKLFKNIPPLQKAPTFYTEEKGLSPFDIGNAYHLIMEKIDLSCVSSYEDLKVQVDKMIENQYLSDAELEAIELEKIYAFFTTNIGEALLESAKVYRETPFVYKKDEFLIQGIIDLYFEVPEGIVLVDYKSDKISRSNEKTLISGHKKQVEIYKEALEKLTSKKIYRSYLYFFNNNGLYEV